MLTLTSYMVVRHSYLASLVTLTLLVTNVIIMLLFVNNICDYRKVAFSLKLKWPKSLLTVANSKNRVILGKGQANIVRPQKGAK